MSELETRLRSLLQPKVEKVDRLPIDSQGEENEMKTVYYKGNYYLAIKVNNRWRYFQETILTEV